MRKVFVVLLIALLLVTAMPAFAADGDDANRPVRYVLWGSVTTIDAAAHTFDVNVLLYRGFTGGNPPPTTLTIKVETRTRFWIRTGSGAIPGTFNDLAAGQVVNVTGVRLPAGHIAQTVVINAEVPPQRFVVTGKITALDAATGNITVFVWRASPPSLGIFPGATAVIATNNNTRFCQGAGGPGACTPITFNDLAVNDWITSAGVISGSTLTAVQVVKQPGPPPQP